MPVLCPECAQWIKDMTLTECPFCGEDLYDYDDEETDELLDVENRDEDDEYG